MPQLTTDQQHELARLLGFYDDLESFNVYRPEFENTFTQANYDRILEIFTQFTYTPDVNDPCDEGGIEYQYDRAFSGTSLGKIENMSFDYNGYIKRLRVIGDMLLKELSNITSIPIKFNKYRTSDKPTSMISYW